ncbi:MAG: efflux RND transporter periplasmic adaptor subunit [Gammaproteobacteria bacterium]|nr:efflux RND transporter periplasmic adaptor subunit [Gammaproteobacteria bacterium]MDH5659421.1 efflux RND transporter periplasmic adaptor subunit [Gammaproteobacteria bacterium]
MTLKLTIKQFFISVAVLMLFLNTTVMAENVEATLEWSKRVELSTPVNGVVQTVFAQPGKIIAKGEVLVQLDPRSFKADLKYAQANVKDASGQYQEAKRELDRQTDMYDRTMLSEHELQVAKNNFTSAHAKFLQAQSSLEKAKLNLEYSAVRSPFNAVIISTKAVQGQVVASQVTPPVLVVVAESQRMLARFYTTAEKVNRFIINKSVTVNVADQGYQGKIFKIALEPSEQKPGNYVVDVIFDPKDSVLRAGQKVTLDL